jgi:hypothetical protein
MGNYLGAHQGWRARMSVEHTLCPTVTCYYPSIIPFILSATQSIATSAITRPFLGVE